MRGQRLWELLLGSWVRFNTSHTTSPLLHLFNVLTLMSYFTLADSVVMEMISAVQAIVNPGHAHLGVEP